MHCTVRLTVCPRDFDLLPASMKRFSQFPFFPLVFFSFAFSCSISFLFFSLPSDFYFLLLLSLLASLPLRRDFKTHSTHLFSLTIGNFNSFVFPFLNIAIASTLDLLCTTTHMNFIRLIIVFYLFGRFLNETLVRCCSFNSLFFSFLAFHQSFFASEFFETESHMMLYELLTNQ